MFGREMHIKRRKELMSASVRISMEGRAKEINKTKRKELQRASKQISIENVVIEMQMKIRNKL